MPVRAPCLALALAVLQAHAVQAACSVDVKPLAFGVIAAGGFTQGTGEVIVRCDESTGFAVELSAGSGKGRMNAAGGGQLAYELYQNAGRSIPWGSGDDARSGRVDAEGETKLTIYGLVPKQSGLLPGTYADQLAVTLSF